MKVGELIKELQKYDDDITIKTSFRDILSVEPYPPLDLKPQKFELHIIDNFHSIFLPPKKRIIKNKQ